MKKIVFLMVALVFAVSLSAQMTLTDASTNKSRDTVTNTATKTMVTKVSVYNVAVVIQVDITKISGTLAGTLIPVASVDGTTYYDVSSTTSRDTAYEVPDASGGYVFSMPLGYKYYGVRWTGEGTMSGSFTAKLSVK